MLKKIKSGIFWNALDAFVIKGIMFVLQFYFAKTLGKETFSFLSILSVFVILGNTLIDSGLSSSLIRHKEVDERDYNTVFYTNIFLSVFIYLLFFFTSTYIANYYEQPDLKIYIRVYSLVFLINAFGAIQNALFTKHMNFRILTLINIWSTLLSIAISLLMIYYDYGIWSIIFMYISQQFMITFLSWRYSNWRPKLLFSIKKLLYHFNYGYKLVVSSLLNVFLGDIFKFIIPKIQWNNAGYYERASMYSSYPVTIITSIISKITFPLFAEIKDDIKKISGVYIDAMQVSFFVTAPIMIYLALNIELLIKIALGDEWLGMVVFFKILCVANMFFTLQYFNLNLLKVYGKTDIFLKLEIYKKIIFVFLILIAYPFGIKIMVSMTIISAIISYFINSYYTYKLINIPLKTQIYCILPTLFLSLSMIIINEISIYLFRDIDTFIFLLINSVVLFFYYLVVAFYFKFDAIKKLLKLLKK